MSIAQLQSLLDYTADACDDAEIEVAHLREDYRVLLCNHILALRANNRWHRSLMPLFERCVEHGLMTEYEATTYEVNAGEDEMSLESLITTYRRQFGSDPFVDYAIRRGAEA